MRNEILRMKCTFEERPWVTRKRKKLPVVMKLISTVTELTKEEQKNNQNGPPQAMDPTALALSPFFLMKVYKPISNRPSQPHAMPAHRLYHFQIQSLTLFIQHRHYLSIGLMRPLHLQFKFGPVHCHLVIFRTFVHQNQTLSHLFNIALDVFFIVLINLVTVIPILISILFIHLTVTHLNHLNHLFTPKHILTST